MTITVKKKKTTPKIQNCNTYVLFSYADFVNGIEDNIDSFTRASLINCDKLSRIKLESNSSDYLDLF